MSKVIRFGRSLRSDVRDVGDRVRKFAYSNESFDHIAHLGSGWFDGACAILAHAVVKAHPGATVHLIGDDRHSAQHVVAKIGDRYIDGDGAHTEQEMLAKMRSVEGLRNPRVTRYDERLLHPDTTVDHEISERIAGELR